MSASFVTIQLDPGHRSYVPGETLAGRFRWDVVHPDKVQSVELSVLWYTEGKGDEDFGVHYFEEHRVAAQNVAAQNVAAQNVATQNVATQNVSDQRLTGQGVIDRLGDRAAWRPFATRLPHSPLSYDGSLVRIRWCVRVRVFLESGKDVVGEKIFRLGTVCEVRHANVPSKSSLSSEGGTEPRAAGNLL